MKRNLSGTEMASKEHREIRKQKQKKLKFEAVRKNAKIHYGVKRVSSGIKITKRKTIAVTAAGLQNQLHRSYFTDS